MLALWKNCDRGHKSGVVRFFEQPGRKAMSYKGVDFMEFLRRALDYPRKDLFDPRKTRIENIINSTITEAMGGDGIIHETLLSHPYQEDQTINRTLLRAWQTERSGEGISIDQGDQPYLLDTIRAIASSSVFQTLGNKYL